MHYHTTSNGDASNCCRVVAINGFWATVCKTVRPMLSDSCLSCPVCPVCNVRALWPNGWTHQDETWHAGRPRPWPHYVRWRSSSPKGAYPQLSAHIRCGQMAAWIKMPLCTEPRRLCVKWDRCRSVCLSVCPVCNVGVL